MKRFLLSFCIFFYLFSPYSLADDNLLSDLMNIFGGMGIDLDNLNLEDMLIFLYTNL